MVVKCVAYLNNREVCIGSQVLLAPLNCVVVKCVALLGNIVSFLQTSAVGTSELRGRQVCCTFKQPVGFYLQSSAVGTADLRVCQAC